MDFRDFSVLSPFEVRAPLKEYRRQKSHPSEKRLIFGYDMYTANFDDINYIQEN
jgi:hypothetical protein